MTENSGKPKSTDRNLLALQRTHMAAERTFQATLRTGFAIAGAGTVIVTILGENWPEWLSLLLAGVFIVVGYTMIIIMLQRYHKAVNILRVDHDLDVMSPRYAIVLTIVLQVALAIVLGLFLVDLFTLSTPFDGKRY
jgi:uncharacterized membrane protein YidH (DUF202 family)